MAVRKNLAFTEKRDRGNGRGEDDAVIDQVPETQRALEMRFPGCCGLRCACGCSHPYLAVPRVSKETVTTATRIQPRRKLALKEKAFLLARFFIAAARGLHGVALGDFGDGYIPPGFVAGNPLVIGG